MNTFCRFLVACVFGAGMITGANAADPVTPPSFLKVGGHYSFFFAYGRDRDRIYAEIMEFGPGPWMRVQRIAPPNEPGKRAVSTKDSPLPGAKLGESWFNLTVLAAVIPAEKQGPDVIPKETPGLPKTGTCYFFSGPSILPYFGKVLELGDEGWFRAQEMTPKWSKDQPVRAKEEQWWINGRFLTQLTEAKQKDLPD